MNDLERVREEMRVELLTAARELLESLGGEDGYFATAGKPLTDKLREAVRLNGGWIIYQRGTPWEKDSRMAGSVKESK